MVQNSNELNPVYQICPHFALGSDSTTKPLFPSAMGCCYHVSPPADVKLTHQQQACLTLAHKECVVFQQERPATFPMKLYAFPPQTTRQRVSRLVVGVVTTAVLLLGLVLWFANRPVSAQFAEDVLPTVAIAAETPTAVSVVEVVPTATDSPTATLTLSPEPTTVPVLIEPTDTSAPTATSLPTIPPTKEPTIEPTTAPTTVSTAIPSATPISEPQIIVNVDRLNIRSGPSTEYPILFVADEGTAYIAIGSVSAQDWWQICCIGDDIGWVFAGSIEFVGDTDAVPPAAFIPPVPPTETAIP